MTLAQLIAAPTGPDTRSHRASVSDEIRLRALERLYARKAAVDELIDSLENYQRCQSLPPRRACKAVSGSRKSS
jgi:hypothetical protein